MVIKWSEFADDSVVYLENPRDLSIKLWQTLKQLQKQ